MTKYCIEGRKMFVELEAEIDHHSVEAIEKKLENEMTLNMTNQLLFDFSNVQFMDSSGIGLVMWGYKRTVLLGGTTQICNLGKRFDRIFRVSGVYRWIKKIEE